MTNTALVTGASGFLGHHLCRFLRKHGTYDRIIGVDIVPPGERAWNVDCDHFYVMDLRIQDPQGFAKLFSGVNHVYHLAANMGGLGFITGNDARVMLDNVTIDTNVVRAAVKYGVDRLLYTSSAVVYPQSLQTEAEVAALRESDAFPYDPSEGGYGFEKLFTEQLCRYVREQHGLETRVVRVHNCYGPEGSWNDGREKAPAALCRKVAEAKQNTPGVFDGFATAGRKQAEIEIWGDGEQTRSFLYVDDALRGIVAVMHASYPDPLNVGSDHLVSINEMADIIAGIAGVAITKRYDLDKPQGVRGRNSDNSLVSSVTGWMPRVSLEDGLRQTYEWIAEQMAANHAANR